MIKSLTEPGEEDIYEVITQMEAAVIEQKAVTFKILDLNDKFCELAIAHETKNEIPLPKID